MVTIDDVARRAGVSTSTVSYALSGKRPISAETRRRVERAITALGYRPHAGARALASARTETIGLMAPLRVGVDVNVIMQFVAGVVAAAGTSGYDVLMVTQDDGALERVAGSSRVDGLIAMDIEADDPRVAQFATLKQPAVLIGLPSQASGLSSIDLDFAQAGALAARHLLALGHRSIALIGSPVEVVNRHTSYAERMTRGFVGACESANASYLVSPTDPSVAGAQASVRRILSLLPEVTGLVVHNEVALAHVISYLREKGLEIPGDISVVAVCPQNVALSQSQPITSIDIPAELIGAAAVEMLTAMLEGEHPSQIRLIGPTLVDRGSTQAPAGEADPHAAEAEPATT